MRNDLAGKTDPFVEKSPNQVNPKVNGSVQVENIQMISLRMTEALAVDGLLVTGNYIAMTNGKLILRRSRSPNYPH